MARKNIKTASLNELKAMQERGELHYDANAPEGEELGEEFWKNAEIVLPAKKKSVHLRIDEDVLEFFKQNGKGHLTRMNLVLRRYMEATKAKPKNDPKR